MSSGRENVSRTATMREAASRRERRATAPRQNAIGAQKRRSNASFIEAVEGAASTADLPCARRRTRTRCQMPTPALGALISAEICEARF